MKKIRVYVFQQSTGTTYKELVNNDLEAEEYVDSIIELDFDSKVIWATYTCLDTELTDKDFARYIDSYFNK